MPGSKSKTSGSETSESSNKSLLFVTRPNQGTVGRPINVFANHFPLRFVSDMLVYHYDIDMEPMSLEQDLASMTLFDNQDKADKRKFKKLNNKINRIVVEEAIKNYSGEGDVFDGCVPVYDGQKNMYSRKELNLNGRGTVDVSGDDLKKVTRIKVEVNYEGRDVQYAVNIKFASIIDMKQLRRYFEGKTTTQPSDAIQVLNIILRHGPTLNKIPIGNSLYAPFNEAGGMRKDIGGGRQLAYGYFQSVRLEKNGVSLVIDRTATALYDSGILAKFVAKILGLDREKFMQMREMRDSDRRRVEKELTGITIQVRHLTYKRKYKVLGLTQEPAEKVQFEQKVVDPRGKETNAGVTTVMEFFQKNYPNIPIKFGHLPCVKVGSTKCPCYLPIDVCELVPDQHVRKNLTADQMVEMIRSSASQSPAQRLEFIKQSAKATMDESKTYMTEFGITFSSANNPLKIEGRLLTPPSLMYGRNQPLAPFDGKWDLRHNEFFQPASLTHWVLIGFSSLAENKMPLLARSIKEQGTRLGMRINDPLKIVTVKNYGPDSITNIFKRAISIAENKLQLIFFVVDLKKAFLYESIKKVGDVDFGIVTQCIKEPNLNNLKPPLIQNIMLKVNTKLGGINQKLQNQEILQRRTMIVGIDCSHPGVGDRNSRSVSAAVASFDDSYVRYFATTRLQNRVQELSNELREMTADLLKEYKKRNHDELPEQIIIYRDGVSEGQFNAALQAEIKALNETFAKEGEGYEPKITYIVVQKRHHTRFFPQNPSEGVGRAKNVPPGLVVDTDVVSKTYFDYFMCSHEGIQGTSRPTHYFVLWDDNQFTADALQQLTFGLTHIYARCTRSISYPAPIAYAHLAAYRANRHIIGIKQSEDISDSGSNAGSSINGRNGGPAPPRRHHPEGNLSERMSVRPEYKGKMYFC